MTTKPKSKNPVSSVDPNILAMLYSRIQGPQGMAEFAPGQSGVDPNLGAALVALGFLPRHQNTRGEYMLPGQSQGGSGLDGQQFRGLDELHGMQREAGTSRYANPTFAQGPARVSQSPTISNMPVPVSGQDGPAFDYRRPPSTMPLGPTVQEQGQFRQEQQRYGQAPLAQPTPMSPQLQQDADFWRGYTLPPPRPMLPIGPTASRPPESTFDPSQMQPLQDTTGQISRLLGGFGNVAQGATDQRQLYDQRAESELQRVLKNPTGSGSILDSLPSLPDWFPGKGHWIPNKAPVAKKLRR